jgi:hypothetical protein
MDLLACPECGRRFYLPWAKPDVRRSCPRCGGDLALARHGLSSIPLDARWLDARRAPSQRAGVEQVELRADTVVQPRPVDPKADGNRSEGPA